MNHPSTVSGHADTVIQIARQPVPPPPNLPRSDLLEGSREDYIKVGAPLYKAAFNGDWKAAKPILDNQPDLIRVAITENYDTLLHIAASSESTKSLEQFVTNIVHLMDPKDLELQNNNHNTALALAAAAGNVKTAMIIVNKNPLVVHIPGNNNMSPIYMSALFAKPNMVRYLYGVSMNMKGDDNCGSVLLKCVEAEIFDVAIKIVNDRPELTDNKRLVTDILLALAQKTDAFDGSVPNVVLRIIKSIFVMFHVKIEPWEKESEALRFLRIFWSKIVKRPKSEIDEILQGPCAEVDSENENKEKECESMPKIIKINYPSRVLFLATKMGNRRFIIEIIRSNPDLIWKQDDKGKTIFHLAARCRKVPIYRLLYEIGAMKDLITLVIDNKGNNMLHMVAKKANQRKYKNGAVLEMQRELLWFKDVERMIPPSYRQMKNNAGKTPQDLFAQKHAELTSKGEDWMNNYLLVATLIATVVFAAAFTLPGGYNQNTGIPFFNNEPSLIIFVISDAISLISSSTSVLIFLSILTSRFTGHDFMESLLYRLMFGIVTLFLSIVTMMVAFSASFFVLYNKTMQWVPVGVTCLAGMPIILFAIMQHQLLAIVYHFTYGSRYLFKPEKCILYY